MKVMLCQPAKLEDVDVKNGWVAERKWDGIRGYIENGKLFDRRGKEITEKFPEFEGMSSIQLTVDGEIVCESFSEIQSRIHTKDKFAIRLLAKKCPAKFVAFDVVENPLLSVPLWERRQKLVALTSLSAAFNEHSWLQIIEQTADVEGLWKRVIEEGWEGIVVKKVDAMYQEGVRSPDWLKIKAWRETIATFIKLDEHPKGVRLESADGHSVNVNGAQAQEVRREFKERGRVTGEVQYLPQEEGDAWRFPSWRGVVDE